MINNVANKDWFLILRRLGKIGETKTNLQNVNFVFDISKIKRISCGSNLPHLVKLLSYPFHKCNPGEDGSRKHYQYVYTYLYVYKETMSN